MSGLADVNKIVDNMVQGVVVSSTIHMVFNRGSFNALLSRKNLMDGAKIGASAHIYQNVLQAPVRSVLDRVGVSGK